MEAPIQALDNLQVPYSHEFSCDFNKHVRATIEANFQQKVFYNDVTTRNNKTAPKTDLYIAGFPCQPFSMAGLQRGFSDRRGRGKIFFNVLDYIRKQRPRVFILENVKGLTTIKSGKYLRAILHELQKLGTYNVSHQVLNTKQHGVPHSRPRWYCVGIHKDFDDGSFSFPEPIKCYPISLFLEKKKKAGGLPPTSQGTARRNVKTAMRTLKREGSDPDKVPFIVDIDSTTKRMGWNNGVAPCITCGRGEGHWVTNRGRRLTKQEMMRLQGMDPTKFVQAVSDRQLGRQLGNTMSVNVVERLLFKVLPAARLVKKNAVNDRWKNGRAVRKLAGTRGKSFKDIVDVKAEKRKAAESQAGRSLKRRKSV